MNKINYIVTGTGRCGTVYLARLLTSLGIPCGHEAIFNCYGLDEALVRIGTNIVVSTRSKEYENDWLETSFVDAESSYLSAPFLNHPLLKNAKIIHLVRNPIRVIFSFCDEFGYFSINKVPRYCEEKFIYTQMLDHNTDIKTTNNHYLRAALFYIKWNEMIEQNCVGRDFLFHRIEDDIQPVLNFVGRPEATDYFKDKRANTKRHNIFNKTLNGIPNSPIKEMLVEQSKKYGYDLLNQPKAPRLLL